MSAQIIELAKPPVPEVIEFLEQALINARAGHTTGILLLEQDADGLSYAVAGAKDRMVIIGWLTHAAFKLSAES